MKTLVLGVLAYEAAHRALQLLQHCKVSIGPSLGFLDSPGMTLLLCFFFLGWGGGGFLSNYLVAGGTGCTSPVGFCLRTLMYEAFLTCRCRSQLFDPFGSVEARCHPRCLRSPAMHTLLSRM